jgi:hypothetical protein
MNDRMLGNLSDEVLSSLTDNELLHMSKGSYEGDGAYLYSPHYPFPKQQAFVDLDCFEAFFGGSVGPGKCSPLGSTVYTPKGPRQMGDLKVGDTITNPDGQSQSVVRIFEFDDKPIYRVTMDDGSAAMASDDHLWLVHRAAKRWWKGKCGDLGKIMTTLQLKKMLDACCDRKERGKNPCWPLIPLTEPVQFTVSSRNADSHWTVPPYLLGAMLGDGSMATARFASNDAEIVEHVRFDCHSIGCGLTDHSEAISWGITNSGEFKSRVDKLGLLHAKSDSKFIPERYKLSPLPMRWALIQGLMDTDGTCDYRPGESGAVFTTVSMQLAKDVQEVCWSLGFSASIGEKKEPFYRDAAGERVICKTAYNVAIQGRRTADLFRLSRKRQAVSPFNGGKSTPKRRVASVEYVGREPARCIAVSHPNGLYLTDDFIVTHNTDALLMSALKYVHIPGYSALILRRDFKRLALDGAIMDRSKSWLHGTDAKWNGNDARWRFPSGASLQFGYVRHSDDRLRYMSAEYQFIGWDELTEFNLPDGEQNPYLFLMSRCRRPKCDIHVGKPDPTCETCNMVGLLQSVPLRIRSASNPGGPGHSFVKNRFVSDEALRELRNNKPRIFFNGWRNTCQGCEFVWPTQRDIQPEKCERCGGDVRNDDDRAFVPALLRDNPVIDPNEYIGNLLHLPKVTRERMINGDWSIIENSLIRQEHIRDFDMQGEIIVGYFNGVKISGGQIDQRQCKRVAIVDTAGTEEDVKDAERGKDPSYTCVEIWDYWPKRRWMFLRYTLRARYRWEGLKVAVRDVLKKWRPPKTRIENKHWGVPLANELRADGVGGDVRTIDPGSKSKMQRATEFLDKVEEGEIFLPLANTTWRPTLESEWFTWTGHPDEKNDQIDTAAYAALEYKANKSTWGGQVAGSGTGRGLPSVLNSGTGRQIGL